jgi:hypothetical protein
VSKPFDATTKRLVELQPDAWARLALGMPTDAPLPAVPVLKGVPEPARELEAGEEE